MNELPHRRLRPVLLPLCLVLLVLGFVVAIGVGPGDLGVVDAWRLVWGALARAVTGVTSPDVNASDKAEVVILALRLPRSLLAILLGACLGAAGAVTQGLFRNALAEPSVLGISMGGAFVAVLGLAVGLDEAALWVTPLLTALGAVGALLLLFLLAGGAKNIVNILLCGVALSSLFSALTTLVLAVKVEQWEVGQKVIAWLMGSLEARSWPHLGWAAPPAVLGLFLALFLRRDLDLLHLGAETATSLGLHLSRTRALAIVAVGILVGTATAVAGVIGFVGLIVPHVARLLLGPGHGRVIPLSIVLGGLTVLLVDLFTRVLTNLVLPPGVVTSLLGAPFFLWLLRRHEGRAVR